MNALRGKSDGNGGVLNVERILNTLGIDKDNLNISGMLKKFGMNTGKIDVGGVIEALGIDKNEIDFGGILKALGDGDGRIDVEGILEALGIDINSIDCGRLLNALGIDKDKIDIKAIADALGVENSERLDLKEILKTVISNIKEGKGIGNILNSLGLGMNGNDGGIDIGGLLDTLLGNSSRKVNEENQEGGIKSWGPFRSSER